MMENIKVDEAYDLIVIGSGAGNIVIDSAIEHGKRCALIEKDKFGGTCLNRGCIPTKVLVGVADNIRKFFEMEKIGLKVKDYEIDLKQIENRVFNKIGENKDVKKYYDSKELVDTYNDKASFLSDKVIKLEASNKIISGDKIVIASGARTKIPKIDGLENIDFLTSEKFFGNEYPKEPYKSIIIVGGGAIGLEFAHVFSSVFGSKLTIVQHNKFLSPKADKEVSEKIKKIFESYGIDVRTNKDTISVKEENGEIRLEIEDITTKQRDIVTGEKILIAPGIMSNADLLSLENTSISLDKKGNIRTNEFLQTSVKDVYALGDINGKFPLRHKANYEAEVLAYNLYESRGDDDYRWASYDVVPSVIYTYSQISHVGLSEDEAIKKGYRVKTAVHSYSSTAKGYALGYYNGEIGDGFIKVILNADTNEFLGVHAIGEESSVLVQPYIELMNCGEKQIKILEEDIAFGKVKQLREKPLKRFLKPNTIETTNETMVAHPSLNEVGIWTKYFEWNEK